jgi:hypothetical protein
MSQNPKACLFRTMRGNCCNQKCHNGSSTNAWRLRRKTFQEKSQFENMREYAKTQSFWRYCICVGLGMVVCDGYERDPYYVEVDEG